MVRFGVFFAELRRQHLGKSLRQFCLDNGLDPGNLSKIERGKLPPPRSPEKLTLYARALGLVEGSDSWLEFFDLAALARGELPADIAADPTIMKQLPVLFRTVRGEAVPDEDLKALLDTITKA